MKLRSLTKALTVATDHPWVTPEGSAQPACAGYAKPEVFAGETPEHLSEALAMCAGCPVSDQCLQIGRMRGEWGVWGGRLLERGLFAESSAPALVTV